MESGSPGFLLQQRGLGVIWLRREHLLGRRQDTRLAGGDEAPRSHWCFLHNTPAGILQTATEQPRQQTNACFLLISALW